MLYYDEIFASIQGESTETGYPCVFVRLYGCPVGCVYCDQPQKPSDRHKASIGTIVEKVRKFKGIDRVCITGGEPMIYDDLMALVYELQTLDYKVSIETSGCFAIEKEDYNRSFRYIMDVKCPSSGVVHKNVYENLVKLSPKDDVVFVIADRADYDFMRQTLKHYPTSAHILLSPLFNKEGKAVIGYDLVDWMLKDHLTNVRVQIQLHKILGVM